MRIKRTGRAVPRIFEVEDSGVGKLPETLEKYLDGVIPTPEASKKYQQEIEEAEKGEI